MNLRWSAKGRRSKVFFWPFRSKIAFLGVFVGYRATAVGEGSSHSCGYMGEQLWV